MSNRKLFYINFGVGDVFSETIIEAEERAAEIYAYQEAKDIFHDVVGTMGILSLEEFLEQNHYEDGDIDAISEYDSYVEQVLFFKVEPYNIENKKHFFTFQMQSFIPVIIK
mgnify:CR=1 FL=1